VVPDAVHTGMWRVRWPDGRLSDITNLTRANDAVACFMETEERRQRGRHSPLEGRLCVKASSGMSDNAAEADPTRNHCAHAARESCATSKHRDH
jgi:hypothetical protein